MRQLPYDIIARDVRDLPDEGLSAALDYLKGDDEAKKLCDRVWRERQDMRLRRLKAAGYRLP